MFPEHANGNGDGRPPPGSLPGGPQALRGISWCGRGRAQRHAARARRVLESWNRAGPRSGATQPRSSTRWPLPPKGIGDEVRLDGSRTGAYDTFASFMVRLD